MELLKIHDQYYDRIKRFILSLVKDEWIADDLVQETFLKIRKHIDSVREPSKISSWIFRIAYNLCQDHFRSTPLKNEKKIDLLSKTYADEIQIQEKLEQNQMGVCVKEKINMLPESLQIPLILFDMEGFTHKEIASILNISEENAKVRLHRARKELKKILKEGCSFERDERDVLVCSPRNDRLSSS